MDDDGINCLWNLSFGSCERLETFTRHLIPTFLEEGVTCHLEIAKVDNFSFRAGKTHTGFPLWFEDV